MTQPFDPHRYGRQAPAPGWAPPGSVPDPRQWQQMPQFGGYPAPPPPAPKKRKWPWIVGGLFVLLFVVPALGNSTSSSSPTTPSNTVASAPASVAAAAPVAPLKAVDDAPAAVPSGPKTSFGDGTWVVGEDIVPGNYRSAGAKEGIFEYCQITTHSDENAESPFLDWKNANANEPIRVKVSGKVKSVEVTGCEDFVKVG
jgi:hypothetical protein